MQRRGRCKWYSLLPVMAATAMVVGALAIFEVRAVPRTETASEPVDETEVTVTFDPDPVKTGYEKNDGGTFKSSLLRHVIATVNPASARDSITFNKADATERVEIQNKKKLGDDKWEFDVAGKLATPVAYPEGDTTIQAKKGGKVVGSVQVIVQVPDKIGKPHPQPSGTVPATNFGMNKGSSPVDKNTPANQVRLVTYYAHPLTVTVVDQFGEHLETAYENKSVFENFGGWFDTNQKLTANGTYKDPVGGGDGFGSWRADARSRGQEWAGGTGVDDRTSIRRQRRDHSREFQGGLSHEELPCS